MEFFGNRKNIDRITPYPVPAVQGNHWWVCSYLCPSLTLLPHTEEDHSQRGGEERGEGSSVPAGERTDGGWDGGRMVEMGTWIFQYNTVWRFVHKPLRTPGEVLDLLLIWLVTHNVAQSVVERRKKRSPLDGWDINQLKSRKVFLIVCTLVAPFKIEIC